MQNQSKDAFPNDTKKNPKDYMVVTLRSGRELESRKEDEQKKTKKTEKEETGEETGLSSSELDKETEKEEVKAEQRVKKGKLLKKEELQAYMPVFLFHQRLQKAKMEKFSRFLDIFKKIEINIPFAEALAHMPNYVKFLKDILSKKRRFVEEEVVSVITTCNAVIQRSLLVKIQDPGSFTIPCTIGNVEFKKALCDSRASINLMPQSIMKRLSLRELTPTAMTLQMADRTMAQPKGVL